MEEKEVEQGLESEGSRLRKLIEFHRQEVKLLSFEARPLRETLQKFTAAINHSLVQIHRAELRLARLEERVKVVPASASGRLLNEFAKLAKALHELPDEKRERVLELLGVHESNEDSDPEDD